MSAARKPKPVDLVLADSTGDAFRVEQVGFHIRLVCIRSGTFSRENYAPALLTPAQARRVARALLRFADGAK